LYGIEKKKPLACSFMVSYGPPFLSLGPLNTGATMRLELPRPS
jgi:hypothetical protein